MKIMENITFNVDDLLIIEDGEYSDKGWAGPVRVIKEFSKKEAADRFVAEYVPDPDHWDYPDTKPQADEFLPWLIKEGYVEDVNNVHSWHVGSYGAFEPGV